MENCFKQMIELIGEDPSRPGLLKTPKRASEALQFLTQGYQESILNIVNGALFESDSNEMVIVKNIELFSLCEHHFLPFIGKCHLAYLPNGKIIGLSKLARIVNVFARRLQIQEKLTKEIANSILEVTQSRGVGVIIEAQHLCMMMRGVEKQNSSMCTSVMLGEFKEDFRTRTEFLTLVKG